MRTKRESKLLSVTMAVLTGLEVLAGAIAVPILCRPFYYAHVQPLYIPFRMGLSEWKIRKTYDEVMDYCLGMTDDFQLTHLKWSAEGAAHFADVRTLFQLDLAALAVAVSGLLILWAAARHGGIRPARIKGHNPGFWAATGLAAVFATLGMLAALDFDAAFTAFHTVFFPGKENWLFDDVKDPVINMLPQVFFQNCALLVLALILASCIILILADRHCGNQHKHIQK